MGKTDSSIEVLVGIDFLNSKSATLKPFIGAILANVIWGSTFLGSKIILNFIPPFLSVFLRFSIASVFLMFWIFISKSSLQVDQFMKHRWDIFKIAFVNYSLLYPLQMFGLKYITSSQSSVIMLLAPIFSLGITKGLGKIISISEWLSIGFAFLGALLITLNSNSTSLDFNLSYIGTGLTFISSFCLGYSIVLIKKFNQKLSANQESISNLNFTFFLMTIGSLTFLPFVGFEIFDSATPILFHWSTFVWILYLSIICSALTFILWNYSIPLNSSIVTSITMYLKTPVAILLGFLIINEQLSLSFYLGTMLIFGPLVFNQITRKG